jgi:hypothetical protein
MPQTKWKKMKDSKRPINDPMMPAPGMNGVRGHIDSGTGYCKGGMVYANGGFIKKAIKRPGALHEALGVPQGQPIPPAKEAAAAKEKGRVGKEARFAEELKGFKKG